uniref:Ig-like domain-containing protein n=1 Tax=Pelusios castaneus TaxID=367368 RepID=A0A8C8SKG5_9SAUR
VACECQWGSGKGRGVGEGSLCKRKLVFGASFASAGPQQLKEETWGVTGTRDSSGGSITLFCRAQGFYPRPIHVSWVRDGEDILAETDSSEILPNADGTYYTQSSLEISPQQEDRHRYACQVEHSSLLEPTLIWGDCLVHLYG